MTGHVEDSLLEPHLFAADTSPALNAGLVSALTERYRERLLLNPPTPSFNTRQNPNAENFAGFASRKDVARFLAVLGDLGLTITKIEHDAETNDGLDDDDLSTIQCSHCKKRWTLAFDDSGICPHCGGVN